MNEHTIKNHLDGVKEAPLRRELTTILSTYCSPSFGSMSKHDIDLLLFNAMVSLGILNETPAIYDVMKELKVTRSKARNLIYEYQLRKTESEEQLKEQLRAILKKPLLSSNSSNVCLEIDNPYLIDFVRNELKKLDYVSDGSFHVELIKISCEAFSALYERMMSDQDKKEIRKKLVELGVKLDTSLKALLPKLLVGVAKKLGSIAMGKIGNDIVGDCLDYLKEHLKELKEDNADLFADNDHE